jgi:sec-independent protein translocase protein TatA
MFGKIGFPELILILVIALVVFGPSKLPEIGESLGKSIRQFKNSVEISDEKEAKKTEE